MWPVPVPIVWPIPLVVGPIAVWAPVVHVRDLRAPGGGDVRQGFADLYDREVADDGD